MKKQIERISNFTAWTMATVLFSGFCFAPATLGQTTSTPCTNEAAFQTPGKWARQGKDDLAAAGGVDGIDVRPRSLHC